VMSPDPATAHPCHTCAAATGGNFVSTGSKGRGGCGCAHRCQQGAAAAGEKNVYEVVSLRDEETTRAVQAR